ncbi:hypothetical protein Y032_0131g1658 [Ancylostoma ceylanicum]|uniref:Uncharacterized protein n=1 Tax=Ancylostoma ceylanicum TaxID=53326 RepID=A0A016T702_9BILA|nr:hypothetical protein Y032_0131g1658 [Ancylostoma ceylanicum]
MLYKHRKVGYAGINYISKTNGIKHSWGSTPSQRDLAPPTAMGEATCWCRRCPVPPPVYQFPLIHVWGSTPAQKVSYHTVLA